MNYSSQKNKTKKRKTNIEDFDEPLEQPGRIFLAEIHGSAQRLLKIKKLSKYIRFCKCCLLPSETTGLVVPYSCLDHKKDFGLGIYLYFRYIRFCIFITFISFCLSSIPTMVFSIRYSNHLTKHCRLYFRDPNKTYTENNTYEQENRNFNPYFITQNESCAKYVSMEYNNKTYIDLDSIISSDWLLKMSADNIKNYYIIFNEKNKDESNDIYDILINYSFLYFLTGITLLIINFFYVHFLNVLNETDDYEDIAPSDFTILVHGVKRPKNNKNIPRKEYLMNLIDEISKNYFALEVHQIIPCYNLVELYKLTKEVFEDRTKIYHAYNFKRQKDLQKKYESYYRNYYKKIEEAHDIETNMTNALSGSNINISSLARNQSQINILGNINYNNSNKNLKKNEVLNYYSKFMFYINATPIKLIQERINKNKERIREIQKEIIENPNKYNCGTYFVVFKYIKMRDEIYDFFPTSLTTKILIRIKYFFQNILFGSCVNEKTKRANFLKTSFTIEHATEAYEVLWKNLGYTQKEKYFYLLISILVTLLLVCVSLAIVLLLNNFQYELKEHGSPSVWKYILSFLISISIAITNSLGRYILKKVTEKFETIETKTGYYISLSAKITFFTFINTTIVPIISNYIRDEWGNNEILLNNVLLIFITNFVLTPFFFYFDPGLLLKLWQRAKARWDLEGVSIEDSTYTQGELNEIFENPKMDLCYKYSFLVNVLLSSLFYMSIFPLGTVFGFIALVFSYFLETYYLGFYKRPELLNPRLCKFFMKYFRIVVSVFFVGNYLFFSSIDKYHKFWPLFNFIFFIAMAFIPYQSFRINLLGTTEGEAKKGSYEDCELMFPTDYEKQNPLTKKKAMIKYFKKLEQMNLIDKYQSDYLINNAKKESTMESYYKTSKNIGNILNSYEFQRQFVKLKKKYKFIKKIRQRKKILNSQNNNYNNIKVNDNELKKIRTTYGSNITLQTVTSLNKNDEINNIDKNDENSCGELELNKNYDLNILIDNDRVRTRTIRRKPSQYMRKTLFQQIKFEGLYDESEEEDEDDSLDSDNDDSNNLMLNRKTENFDFSLLSNNSIKKNNKEDDNNSNGLKNLKGNKDNDLFDKKSELSLYSIKTNFKDKENKNNIDESNNQDFSRHLKNKSYLPSHNLGNNFEKLNK